MPKTKEIQKEKHFYSPNLLFCPFCQLKVHVEIHSKTGYLTYLLIIIAFLIFPWKIASITIPFMVYLTREKIFK